MSAGAEAPLRSSKPEIGPFAPLHELPPLPAQWRSLPRAFIHQARALSSRTAMVDSTGASLTFGQTFLRALALGRVLAREWGAADHVGLMVPPTVPAAVANLAVSLWGKIPVNLNYSASQALVDASIDQCGITHVLTSSKVLDRFKITPKGQLILLEEIPKKVRSSDKLWAAAVAKLGSDGGLVPFRTRVCAASASKERRLSSLHRGRPAIPRESCFRIATSSATPIRSRSTSTSCPRRSCWGFCRSSIRWASRSRSGRPSVWEKKLSITSIRSTPGRSASSVTSTSVTLLVGTPSFMRFYLKNCEPRQFHAITHLILGAEKLKPEMAREIQNTLHIEPMEGYGCTELSPVVSVNVPREVEMKGGRKIHGNRLGTVGQPLPGTAIKTVDPDTGADLPAGAEGVIAVKGPQVMVGYLNRPEATAQVIKEGWYLTGDLGYVDADGFLKITDRLSRFSKIAGEMVPHVSVESAIMEATGVEENQMAVVGVPDPKHGEKLCVLYTNLGMSPAEVRERLTAGPLPRVWIPSIPDFIQVQEIPITPTGKVNLRMLKDIAVNQAAAAELSRTR